MRIDAALYSGSKCYFFSGDQYIRVTRGDTGAGTVDPNYPSPISAWNWPAGFGATGIDAALYSGSKCYFFSGDQYIRVTRGDTGAGTVDPNYPSPISAWNWPAGFGATGIDAALYSGSKCYFFSGDQYIRVTRGDTGAGTVDPNYPSPISAWNWPAGFGATGIDAALYSGSKCYFFSGDQYIRVTRGDTGAGTVDPNYPSPISAWMWPAEFGASGTNPVTVRRTPCEAKFLLPLGTEIDLGTAVNLTWTDACSRGVRKANGFSYVVYRNGQEIAAGEGRTYTIPSTLTDQFGLNFAVQVVASNDHGRSSVASRFLNTGSPPPLRLEINQVGSRLRIAGSGFVRDHPVDVELWSEGSYAVGQPPQRATVRRSRLSTAQADGTGGIRLEGTPTDLLGPYSDQVASDAAGADGALSGESFNVRAMSTSPAPPNRGRTGPVTAIVRWVEN